jgi:hypothetical protein
LGVFQIQPNATIIDKYYMGIRSNLIVTVSEEKETKKKKTLLTIEGNERFTRQQGA